MGDTLDYINNSIEAGVCTPDGEIFTDFDGEEMGDAVGCDKCDIYWSVEANPPKKCPNCGGDWVEADCWW